MTALDLSAPPPVADATEAMDARVPRSPRWGAWHTGIIVLGVVAAALTTWGVWTGSRSDYYASIALSMSQSWSNFLFGAFDPAGTVTLDKIPGSFWIPALFVRLFGFSTFTVILPNALAAVAAALLVAVTAKRLLTPTAGLVAGAVVATTPILVAVSRSNQPETFFVLGLALTAWAAAKALSRGSFGWLMLAGVFIAVSFQTYMLEAWAVWPALAAAYLCTRQPMLRKLWQAAAAAIASLALSLTWIVVVAAIPASSRPYIGSTLHNEPWEMVFGYNGLGRFGSSTADASAYNSFTPPFSGSAGVFRLFNEQLAGQIGWMIPAAALAVVVLAVLRFRVSTTVFLGVWLVTFYGMFAVVAGMHQFYTAALSVPMALAIGLAIGWARTKRIAWPQIVLVAVAVVTAVAIAFGYGGYSIPVAAVQACAGAAAISLMVWERRRRALLRWWTASLTTVALLLTPAVWSTITIWNPSSINPVAGGVADQGGGFGGGALVGPGGGFAGAPGASAGQGTAQGGFGGRGQGGFGGRGGAGGAQNVGPGAQRGAGGMDGASGELLGYLEQNKGDASYLVAVFGAQTAAGLIIDSGGQSVLPIGGFSGSDPVPTLARFTALVDAGELKYVLVSGGGFGGGTRASGGTAGQIRTWVEKNCTEVTDGSVSGLYVCTASRAG